MNIRDLDLMSYREKTLHWMRPDCWKPDGARLRFRQPERAVRASTDRRGSVRYMPLLVARPCFGIITAFIRYKDALKPVRGRGLLPASRCADCKVRAACESLVRERIATHAPLSAAYDDWLRAEGPSRFGDQGFEDTHVGRLWKRVGLTAADAGFTSSNDAAVAQHYEKLDQERQLLDRHRRARKREQERRGGKIDSDHFADLEMASNTRLIAVLEAMNDPRAPKCVSQLPIPSLEDMRDVWLGREVLKAERKKHKAPDIARWLQANGRRAEAATFAALCTRVSKDLGRIGKFERLIWNGAPLIKPFRPSEEYWSRVWLEVTPARV